MFVVSCIIYSFVIYVYSLKIRKFCMDVMKGYNRHEVMMLRTTWILIIWIIFSAYSLSILQLTPCHDPGSCTVKWEICSEVSLCVVNVQ